MRVLVTGASGWIGSAVVPELLAAGHEITGLARSDASAAALEAAGARVQRGSLDDLDTLHAAAAASDGVIHLAFKHDIAFSGQFAAAAAADRRAIETLGEALAGSDRPLVIAAGILALAPGRVATEQDGLEIDPSNPVGDRMANALLALELASRRVRSVVLRLPPTVHGQRDNGFIAMLVGIAREKRLAGYIGDGSARWPAVHRRDAAVLFRLALENAALGSVLHAVAEEGVPTREIAAAIGRSLDVPVGSVAPQEAAEHFGFLAGFLGVDSPASSARTREALGWEPTQPGLLDDLAEGRYLS